MIEEISNEESGPETRLVFGRAKFESRPGHHLFWPRPFVIFFRLLMKVSG